MNTVKKIMALITIVLVVIRLFVINVYASFAAPIMAEETLKTILIDGLLAGGSDYTKDDLESWELNDLENEFEIQMTTNPNFNAKKVLPVLVSDDFSVIPGSPEDIAKKEAEMRKFREQTDKAVSDWLNYIQSNGEDLYDFMNPTYNIPIDIQGNGCVLVVPFSNAGNGKIDRYRVIYGEYGLIKKVGDEIHYSVYNVPKSDIYDLNWNFKYSQSGTSVSSGSIRSNMERYGDWRFEDGTKADTDDNPIPVIGEVAGTQVTPDMLNPDGTVTIGGITYYPKDFIDWDKFKDPAIIDLLNKILAKIDDIPVISEQDKPLVDVDEIEVSVPEELSDYAAPIGISNVFPFCIPWDIVRGFQILNRPSVTPKFEIPFNIPEFGLFDGVEETITIDFTEYDKYVQIFRWFQIVGFSFLLCKLSLTRVKGAGA